MAGRNPYSLWIRHNYDVRRFVLYRGYPVQELTQVLQASFDDPALPIGAQSSAGGTCTLAQLCAEPENKVRAASLMLCCCIAVAPAVQG